MSNFFGFDTADSSYDKRRHINLVYYSMMYLRLLSGNSLDMANIKRILSSNSSSLTKANMMRQEVLSDYEVSYLNYLQKRYGLPENDYVTILAGETLTQGVVKSPAGYTSEKNWELIIQIMYSTMLSGPSYQHLVQRLVSEFLIPISSRMRGIRLQSSTFRLISENMNFCLNQGKRQWSDLPYIERYVISRII
ncbi:MAG: hypothetical protein J6C18_07780 [Bacteroidaceae bacterium]|nr:hypothetical protein [Bacteroidaceae bacterium]